MLKTVLRSFPQEGCPPSLGLALNLCLEPTMNPVGSCGQMFNSLPELSPFTVLAHFGFYYSTCSPLSLNNIFFSFLFFLEKEY